MHTRNMSLCRFYIFFLLLVNQKTLLDAKLVAEEELLYEKFPEGFIWGVASSAYQVEGGWNLDGKGLSNWDVWTQDPSHISDQSSGQMAADSFHKYKEDVKLIAEMGLDFYRVSIAWARIIPNGLGDINQKVCIYVLTYSFNL